MNFGMPASRRFPNPARFRIARQNAGGMPGVVKPVKQFLPDKAGRARDEDFHAPQLRATATWREINFSIVHAHPVKPLGREPAHGRNPQLRLTSSLTPPTEGQ